MTLAAAWTCLLIAAAGCESIDCPINNIVYSTYGFYAVTDEGESKIQLLDTLTVTTAGTDSVLVNRLAGGSEVDLPVSYAAATDTLVFHLTGTEGRTRRDTIWVDKENIPHYESPNCQSSMFHHVTAVRWTRLLVDSVSIANPNIDYDISENFKIYFRSGD